jgi:small subunit ribosomal protein S4
MGDPRKRRKSYSTPSHPWQRTRIEEEKVLVKEYGVANKKEIWKMNSILRRFASVAKNSVALKTKQGEKEKKQMLDRLQTLGLLTPTAQAVDVLNLKLKDIMERRLQTLIHRKGMARTIKQARQFITHRHITVAGKMVTQPSYLVLKKEEDKIGFLPSSSLSNPEHSERTALEKKKEEKKVKPKFETGRRRQQRNRQQQKPEEKKEEPKKEKSEQK